MTSPFPGHASGGEWHCSITIIPCGWIWTNARGCTTCLKRCPTEAIRIRNNRASILNERCIDCGECIKVCANHAKVAVTDPLESIKRFKYLYRAARADAVCAVSGRASAGADHRVAVPAGLLWMCLRWRAAEIVSLRDQLRHARRGSPQAGDFFRLSGDSAADSGQLSGAAG